jgi:hypothetical protein
MGNKGYDGFIVTQPGGGGRLPNTVIAGHRRQQQQEELQQLKTPVVLSTVKESKEPEVKLGILVPFDDKAKRIQYLRMIRDYLNTQLAIVDEQLAREE